MSAAEILYRLGEQSKRLASKTGFSEFPVREGSGQIISFMPGISERLSTAYIGLSNTHKFVTHWRDIKEGRHEFLGQKWPRVSGAEKWHLDPVTGKQWPENKYCFDIPYRHAPNFGDVKYVWELNRLQYLQPIAVVASLNGDGEAANFCLLEIESWIDANPPFKGINWASGIELALRTVSILSVVGLLGEDAFSNGFSKKLFKVLSAHGYWLKRFPSRYSSANNHLIAEAGALFLLGILYNSLPQADEYRLYGYRTLCEEIEKQIYPDGVGVEQSPSYQAVSLEWFLLCGRVGEQHGQPFPEEYWQRMATAGLFLRWITDEGGHQPRIGDDDEGFVLYSEQDSHRYVNSVLGAVSAALNRPGLMPPHYEQDLRNVVLVEGQSSAPDISDRDDDLDEFRQFPDGGYSVWRGGYGGKGWNLIFDHGPVGYSSIAAHGHADALAIWLHIDGIPILVDAGTYLYHSGGEWREYFRSSMAHNTLTINGESSSLSGGPFNWRRKAETSMVSIDEDAGAWRVEAENNGFEGRYGVRHRRLVERTSNNGIRISDRLVGGGSRYNVRVGFLINPELQITEDESKWTIGNGECDFLQVSHIGPLSAALLRGEAEPKRGWLSDSFGHKVECEQLVYSGTVSCEEPCVFDLTVLAE